MIKMCKSDPDIIAETNQSIMNSKKWTQEQIDYMAEFEKIGNYHIVSDFSTGFDSETSNLISDILVNSAFFPDSEGWTVLRDSNINTIDTAIAELNG